jgi:S1-C subfamily serine protease
MKTAAILIASLLLTHSPLQLATAQATPPDTRIAQEGLLTPQQVQQRAKNITVRITSENNGGSGVIIAQKGDKYLILTNAHVVRRATKIAIQAPDGQKYAATPLDGGFDAKYDLALLQFTSRTKYTLPDLSGISGSPITTERTIYSAGFPFDASNIRITKGQVSQLSDISFNDGTQIGYVTNKGEKGSCWGLIPLVWHRFYRTIPITMGVNRSPSSRLNTSKLTGEYRSTISSPMSSQISSMAMIISQRWSIK